MKGCLNHAEIWTTRSEQTTKLFTWVHWLPPTKLCHQWERYQKREEVSILWNLSGLLQVTAHTSTPKVFSLSLSSQSKWLWILILSSVTSEYQWRNLSLEKNTYLCKFQSGSQTLKVTLLAYKSLFREKVNVTLTWKERFILAHLNAGVQLVVLLPLTMLSSYQIKWWHPKKVMLCNSN